MALIDATIGVVFQVRDDMTDQEIEDVIDVIQDQISEIPIVKGTEMGDWRRK